MSRRVGYWTLGNVDVEVRHSRLDDLEDAVELMDPLSNIKAKLRLRYRCSVAVYQNRRHINSRVLR